MNIAVAAPSDFGGIAALYAEAGYGAPIDPADTVLVAKDEAQLVGVVRLCPEHGVTVLRGMQIRSAYQLTNGLAVIAMQRPPGTKTRS